MEKIFNDTLLEPGSSAVTQSRETDAMFAQDPRQSTRSRTYFNPDIYIPSLKLNWKISDRTSLLWTKSAVLGARNSVHIDAFATIPDTINRAMGLYKGRQVDVDHLCGVRSPIVIMPICLFNRVLCLSRLFRQASIRDVPVKKI